MSDFWKIILTGASIFAILYYRIYHAVTNFVLGFNGITPEVIASDYVRLGIILDVQNNSNTQVKIENIDFQLLINGRYVGNLNNSMLQYVPAKGQTNLFFTVDLLYNVVGAELFNILKSGTGYDFNLNIRGVVYFDGLPIPIPTLNVGSSSVNDLLNAWK